MERKAEFAGRIALFVLALAAVSPASGTTYFVDFAQGDDTNPGDSRSHPFRHSPGDKNATDNARIAQLRPGDRIVFRGGTRYRGSIFTKESGTVGKPIVYDGNVANNWGTGAAIIDGGEEFGPWRQCGSNEQDRLVCATLDEPWEGALLLRQGEHRATPAEVPERAAGSSMDDMKDMFFVSPRNVSTTSIVAPELLSFLSGAWKGSTLLIWGMPNTIYSRPILSYDPESGSASFDAVSVYKDRPTRFRVINHPRGLGRPGAYVLSPNRMSITFHPYDSVLPQDLHSTVSERSVGIEVLHSNITVQGFELTNIVSSTGEHRSGAAIRVSGDKAGRVLANVHLVGNEVWGVHSEEEQGAITVVNVDGASIFRNRIHDNTRSRGILAMNSPYVVAVANQIYKNGGTGIAFFGAPFGEIRENDVSEILGPHANGISVYLSSDHTRICGNVVRTRGIALTTKHSSNLLVANNWLNSTGDTYTVADWGSGSSGLVFVNNSLTSNFSKALYISDSAASTTTIGNNAIDGVVAAKPGAEFLHNVYTSRSWQQSRKYEWRLGKGDQLGTRNDWVRRMAPGGPSSQKYLRLLPAEELSCGAGTVDRVGAVRR